MRAVLPVAFRVAPAVTATYLLVAADEPRVGVTIRDGATRNTPEPAQRPLPFACLAGDRGRAGASVQ